MNLEKLNQGELEVSYIKDGKLIVLESRSLDISSTTDLQTAIDSIRLIETQA